MGQGDYPVINDEALDGFPVYIDGVYQGYVSIHVLDGVVATRMLKGNDVNRHVRPRRVNAYTRDMKNGQWPWLGDPLRIDSNGKVGDGQHRLLAIQKADVALPFLVIGGASPASQEKYDQGSARTAADALKMRFRESDAGGGSWSRVSGLVRRVLLYDQGVWAYSGKVDITTSDILDYVTENEDLVWSALKVASHGQRFAGFAGSIVGGAYLICSRIDERAANIFFDQVITGENIKAKMPAYTLRNKINGNERLGDRKISRDDMFRFFLRAWNAFRDGEELERLTTPPGGWTSKNSPVAR